MLKRQQVELAKSYLLLNHGPVTLVSSAQGGRQNVMAAAWAMPLDFDPPKVAVVIDSQSYTRELVEGSGEFVLNIPPRAMAGLVLAVGSTSGREVVKFARLGMVTHPASQVGAPLIDGCLGWLECRLIAEAGPQLRYDLFVAEVVAAWADPDVFNNDRWTFTDNGQRTIHYIAGGNFFVTGNNFAVNPVR